MRHAESYKLKTDWFRLSSGDIYPFLRRLLNRPVIDVNRINFVLLAPSALSRSTGLIYRPSFGTELSGCCTFILIKKKKKRKKKKKTAIHLKAEHVPDRMPIHHPYFLQIIFVWRSRRRSSGQSLTLIRFAVVSWNENAT